MDKNIRLIWKCKKCNDVVVSYSFLSHDMNYCECGLSAVDLEPHYRRDLGEVIDISIKLKEEGKWVEL